MGSQRGEFRTALHKYKRDRRTQVLQLYGLLTAKLRLLPEFIIIGAQRAGTTSLYNYLAAHPNIRRSVVKEIHYFDIYYHRGSNWYRGNFPMLPSRDGDQRVITGEASPYYIIHPLAPLRTAACVPSAKIIVLLRDPVSRAYSNFQHETGLGYETLSFEVAIDRENDRLNGEVEKMLQDETYFSFNHRHYAYLSRGIYVDQIKNWERFFPREQILVIKSEDFFHSPQEIFSQVLGFLDLPDWKLPKFKIHNRGQYEEMNPSTRERLVDYFAPHNRELEQYLGREFGWNS